MKTKNAKFVKFNPLHKNIKLIFFTTLNYTIFSPTSGCNNFKMSYDLVSDLLTDFGIGY
jgi:hypothetical protein